MHPKVTNVPKQISLLRSSLSFFCVGIYKDLAPPEPFFQRPARPYRTSLGWPSRSSNYTAEVATAKGVILVGQHICLNVAKGRFRFVFDTVVEGSDDVFLKMAVRGWA